MILHNSTNGSYITGFYFLPPRMGKEMTLQEILTRSTLPASDVFNLDFFYKGAKFYMAFSTEHELSSTRFTCFNPAYTLLQNRILVEPEALMKRRYFCTANIWIHTNET